MVLVDEEMKRWKQGWVCLEGNPLGLESNYELIQCGLQSGCCAMGQEFHKRSKHMYYYTKQYDTTASSLQFVALWAVIHLSSGMTVVYFSDIIIHVL